MRMVFDLDGVLVDTKEANLLAYQSIGVTPPGNFHVRPWQQWITEEAHEAKNRALPQFRSKIRQLPLLAIARPEDVVLSNCSDAALELICQIWPIRRIGTVMNGMDAADKTNWLNLHGKRSQLTGLQPGTYFDDSAETCAFVAAHTEWQTCRVL